MLFGATETHVAHACAGKRSLQVAVRGVLATQHRACCVTYSPPRGHLNDLKASLTWTTLQLYAFQVWHCHQLQLTCVCTIECCGRAHITSRSASGPSSRRFINATHDASRRAGLRAAAAELLCALQPSMQQLVMHSLCAHCFACTGRRPPLHCASNLLLCLRAQASRHAFSWGTNVYETRAPGKPEVVSAGLRS